MKQLQSTESYPSPIPKQFKIKIWLSDTAEILSKKKKNASFCHFDNFLKCQTSVLPGLATNLVIYVLKPETLDMFVFVPKEIRVATIQNIRNQHFEISILLNFALLSNHVSPFVLAV